MAPERNDREELALAGEGGRSLPAGAGTANATERAVLAVRIDDGFPPRGGDGAPA